MNPFLLLLLSSALSLTGEEEDQRQQQQQRPKVSPKHDLNRTTLPKISQRINHFECFNVVRVIERQLLTLTKYKKTGFNFLDPKNQRGTNDNANNNGVNNNNNTNSIANNNKGVPAAPARLLGTEEKQNGQKISDITLTDEDKVAFDKFIEKFGESCQNYSDARGQVCRDLVQKEKLDKIVELILKHRRPDFICNKLGFQRGNTAGREINEKDCTDIIHKIKGDLNRQALLINRIPSIRRNLSLSNNSNSNNQNQQAANVQQQTGKDQQKQDPTAQKVNLLEDPPVNGQQQQTNQGIQKDIGGKVNGIVDKVKNRFSNYFSRSPKACEGLPSDKAAVCHVLSRLVARGMKREVVRNTTELLICQKLHELHLIKLTNKTLTYEDNQNPASIKRKDNSKKSDSNQQ